MSKLNRFVKDQDPKHILYAYNDLDSYVEQLVQFILNGVQAGVHVLCIENMRLYPKVKKQVDALLTRDEKELVHHVNNFDFYFSSGSYHPPAILDYFNEMTQPFIEKKRPFRSWAHVEWDTMTEPVHLIQEFEQSVDEAVHNLPFTLVCAYKRAYMPAHLERILHETHPYIFVDDEIHDSDKFPFSNIGNE